jgi:dTDP-4-dehydrorhamnose 3,5-epimerase
MSTRFDLVDTPLEGLRVIQRKPCSDHRGYLERMYCESEIGTFLQGRTIAQINRTLTMKRGALRGMHFQFPPYAETKVVNCIRGEVFDVAVDLRHGSPTFLRWHGEVLSAVNHRTLLIPEGFAHGFQTLTEDCELLYFHTAMWNSGAEGGLNPHDSELNISWPLPATEISPRDAAHPVVTPEFVGVRL